MYGLKFEGLAFDADSELTEAIAQLTVLSVSGFAAVKDLVKKLLAVVFAAA